MTVDENNKLEVEEIVTPPSSETTVSQSTFTSVSGDIGGDPNVTYSATKGSATTEPAIYNSIIRIYQNGGLLTIQSKNNKFLKSVTIGSNMATKVTYAINGNTNYGNEKSIAKDNKITISLDEATSITFKCTGTTSSARLYLNYLSVTYC